MLSTQFPRVVHIIDSEAMVTAQEKLGVSPEADARESDGQDGAVERDLGLEAGKDEDSKEISGDGRVEERLLESPITIDVDAELPTATFNGLLLSVPGSIVPPNDGGPVIEEDRSETSQPIRTVDSPMLVEQEGPLILSGRHGAGPHYQQAPESSIETIPMADTPLPSDSYRWSLKSLRYQPDPTLTVLSPARRPIISLAASSYVASEPCFNLEGTLPHPPTPHPPTLPVQPRHQFEREYALPSLKLLPLEYSRKVKSAKLQRKREKGREKNEGRRDKDGTRDDWYPLGLNRWAAAVSANPVWKRVSRASKCLSTREWAVGAFNNACKFMFNTW
jgi:chromatin modification-related protein VID21